MIIRDPLYIAASHRAIFHAMILDRFNQQKAHIDMYIFSVNANTTKDIEDFPKGAEVPFIIYINFKDLFGAEQLCRSYLIQQGFERPTIEKRKLIEEQFLNNKKLIDADPALKEALNTGYSIQIYSAH